MTTDAIAAAAVVLGTGQGLNAAFAALIQPFVTRAMALSKEELSSRAARAHALWPVAIDRAGGDPEALLDAMSKSPDHMHLAYTAVDGASESRYPERIIALGRAMADGLLSGDEARLDHEQLVITALASLDRPHLVVLWALIEEDALKDWRQLTLSWEDLCGRVPNYREASITRLVATLDREGMLDTPSLPVAAPDDMNIPDDLHAGQFWAVSDFGIDVLQRLHDAGRGRTP